MVEVNKFLSRIGHMIGMMIIGGGSIIKVLSRDSSLHLPKWVIPVALIITVITGIYNIILLKPKETMGNKRSLWVTMMYLKAIILLVGSPLVMFIFGRESSEINIFDALTSLLLVIIGSYSRYYREENTIKSAFS